jgi:DNA-binding transcriptional regulator YiaG
LPSCHMTLSGAKPQPKGYPAEPQTIGEHLKKKRMELNVLQREVADQIGIDVTTYRNWEWNRTSPLARFMPAVIKFLGYIPYVPVSDFGIWVKMVRCAIGLSQRRFAEVLGHDPVTLGSWETGKRRPATSSFKRVLAFTRRRIS